MKKSATLKAGQWYVLMCMSMKSKTAPYFIRSIKFPSAPLTMNEYVMALGIVLLFTKRYANIKAIIPVMNMNTVFMFSLEKRPNDIPSFHT